MGVSLLLASAFAGTLSRSIVHPLDTLRSRLMVSTSATSNLQKALSEVIRTDGLKGLYRGFGISVAMQAPAVATYLSTYDYSKYNISSQTGISDKNPFIHLGSGLIAETVSAVFWVPMEVIKQRAQVRTGGMAVASSAVIARDLLAHEGPRALFKGYGLTVGVFGPYSMIYFVAYERLKQIAGKASRTSELSTGAVATSAALAGAVAAAFTTPLDVVKTRLQTQGDIARGGVQGYNGTWDACKMIARQEGAKGFLRGISARVLWIMPGTAITMSTFEFLKSYFQLKPEE